LVFLKGDILGKMLNLGILVFSLFLALVLFGCTSTPVCGNGACEIEETNSICPQDCGVELSCIDNDVNDASNIYGSYFAAGTAQGYPDTVQGSANDCCMQTSQPGACVNIGPYLSEAFCNESVPSSVMYECPYGCMAGACVSNEVTISKELWKNAEPWGIVDWSKHENILWVVLTNNTDNNLTLKAFIAGDSNYLLPSGGAVLPNSSAGLQFVVSTSCVPNEKYVYTKEDIQIIYDTDSIQNKVEYGVADIVGECLE